jgi:hypothetical protein
MNRFQISTNLAFDMLSFANMQLKCGLLSEEYHMPVSIAIGVGYTRFIYLDYFMEGFEEGVNEAQEADTTHYAPGEEPQLTTDVSFATYTEFISISKKLSSKAHMHAGVQAMQGGLKGDMKMGTTNSPKNMALMFNGETKNISFLIGGDFVPTRWFIILGETGYDFTNKNLRAGAGINIGPPFLRLQVGASVPGPKALGDTSLNFEAPIMPSFNLYLRF